MTHNTIPANQQTGGIHACVQDRGEGRSWEGAGATKEPQRRRKKKSVTGQEREYHNQLVCEEAERKKKSPAGSPIHPTVQRLLPGQ